MRARDSEGHGSQRGVSLVELLIGMVVGLFIVGAGVTVAVVHLHESRAMVAQSRWTQDLHAVTDLIARDLRRVGYWGDAGAGVWPRAVAPGATGVAANPYTAMTTIASPTTAIDFRYSRDAVENDHVDDNEHVGYRLRNGVLELQLGGSPWQAMTDITAMRVTGFDIAPTEQVLSLEGSCSAPCPADSDTCPPRLHERSITVTVTARGVADPAVQRTARARVRLRNDEITGRCPA